MNRKGCNFYFPYIIIFLGITGALFLVFFNDGKTLVRNGDALTQHYPAFLYIGRYYRVSLKEIFLTHRFPSMWDFSIGYGSDVIQTLTYYGLSDWSTVLFAVFSNSKNGTILYTAMMVFRTFLTGLSFLFFCKRFKCSVVWSTAACFAYLFCPYMLETVFNGHHFMGLPLLYLPIILVYVDKNLKSEKTRVFPLIISLSILSSYYFFYMELICAFVFFVSRYFEINKKMSIKSFLIHLARVSLYVVTGLLIASPIIGPQVFALFSDSRMNIEKATNLLYSKDEYLHAIKNLVSSDAFSYYSYIGVSSIVLIGVMILILKNKARWLQCMLFTFGLTICIPITGKIMNGFSYVANRHVWILIFLVCVALAKSADEIKRLKKMDKCILVGVVLIYTGVLFWIGAMSDEEIRFEIILLLVGVLAISFWPKCLKKSYEVSILCIVFVLVFVGVAVHIKTIFVNREGYSSFLTPEQVDEIYYNDHDAVLDTISDDGDVFRVDWNYGKKKPNAIDVQRYCGSAYSYWSFQNASLVRYLNENGLLGLAYEIDGLDNRQYLRSLRGCKYVIDLNNNIPSIYNMKNRNIGLCLNSNSLPIIRLYDRTLSEAKYLSSTFGQKPVLESEYCILKNGEERIDIDEICEKAVYKLDYDIETKNTIDKNAIIVRDTNEKITFNIKCPADGELYLEIYNLKTNQEANGDNTRFYAICEDVKQSWVHYSPYDKYYFGKRDYNFNFDYSSNERTTIELYFDAEGVYSFDQIVVEFVPYDAIEDTLVSMQSYELENLQLVHNSLLVDVNLESNKILYCDIPFSRGWKAQIDGIDQPIMNANIMGIGIKVPAGKHNIVLKYKTPFLITGMFLSALGWIVYLSLILCGRFDCYFFELK